MKKGTGDWARDITDNFGIKVGGSFEFEGKNGELYRARRKRSGWHIDKLTKGLFGGERWERVKTWCEDNNNKSLKISNL